MDFADSKQSSVEMMIIKLFKGSKLLKINYRKSKYLKQHEETNRAVNVLK
jgi:hypothetical protein